MFTHAASYVAGCRNGGHHAQNEYKLCEIVNYNSISYGLVFSAGSFQYEVLLISSQNIVPFYCFIPSFLHFLPLSLFNDVLSIAYYPTQSV
jgi:hypothetical protein